MKVTMLLADAAQAVDNKLYILGGGWSITSPGGTPFGIAIKIEVPWTEADKRHTWQLRLTDQDGHPFTVEHGAEREPLTIGGGFEVGRPAGLRPGTPIDFTLAINSAPLPLRPATRYMWRLYINDETADDWFVSFWTRPE
jgi:hypothetical protein